MLQAQDWLSQALGYPDHMKSKYQQFDNPSSTFKANWSL